MWCVCVCVVMQRKQLQMRKSVVLTLAFIRSRQYVVRLTRSIAFKVTFSRAASRTIRVALYKTNTLKLLSRLNAFVK